MVEKSRQSVIGQAREDQQAKIKLVEHISSLHLFVFCTIAAQG